MDSISGIAPVQGASELYQKMEQESTAHMDLLQQERKAYVEEQQALAKSTGDSTISSLATKQ